MQSALLLMRTEIISYALPEFSYLTPIIEVNNDGEVVVELVEETPSSVPASTFLFRALYSNENTLDSIEGINEVNAFLMHQLINRGCKGVGTYSKALIQYFQFLADNQLTWDEMSPRNSSKPTYRFKRYLEQMYRENQLGETTCKAYINAVVKFYKHWLIRKHPFTHAPFEHEIISIRIEGAASQMQATNLISVHTTDLRLKIARQKQNIPNKLRALSVNEWQELDHVLRLDRRVIEHRNGKDIAISLPLEFSYMFMLMRYTGMRRSEANSITTAVVIKPTPEQLSKGYLTMTIGPRFGIMTKNSKEREIEIPSALMSNLYQYSISVRYIKRRNKFITKAEERSSIPLFLNNRGGSFSATTVNGRWGEIRNALALRIGQAFDHKVHNLRSTYAVERLKALLNARMQQGDALSFIQSKLGHSDLTTTLHYLKQAEGRDEAFKLAEVALDHLFNIDGSDFEVAQ